MSFSTFAACINKLPPEIRIHFSGFSEPFLNPACTDMILYAYQLHHDIIVYSTLVGFTESDAARLKDVRFKKFVVHVEDGKTNFKNQNEIELLDKYGIKYATYNAEEEGIINRAGNLDGSQCDIIAGPIKCDDNRHMQNVLLPNGDVVLCCMDYGLEYKLGNLIQYDYVSLFNSSNFRRIIQGMKDDSMSIICRRCNRAVNA